MLELTPTRNGGDIYAAKDRARQIIGAWFAEDDHTLNLIVRCLAEACSNVVDHSGSEGMLVIQKYAKRQTGVIEVQLAIADLGLGIPASLRRVHADLNDTAAGYIRRALDGLSSRERGGLGLVTAPEVSSSVERHVNKPREVALSKAALEVLAIIAYRQPIARAGIELIRGSASDSALDTLLQRGLITQNPHHLFVTTRAFLGFVGLRDLADLPLLDYRSKLAPTRVQD